MIHDIGRQTLRGTIAAAMMALTLVACDSKKTPDAKPADSVAPQAPPPPSAPSPEHMTPNANPQIDTTDGTMSVTGTGGTSGTWAFSDVNATLEERAGGGTTQGILMIEAHDAINGRHLQIRLLRDGAPIDPGTYPVGDPGKGGRRVDPRWEMDNQAFRALEGGRGSVVLKSLAGDRAVGTFELTLPSLENPKLTETLKGSFDQRVQR